jgi:ribosomal protein S8
MVGFSSSIFISRFNNSIIRRSKSFNVPVSRFSQEILVLFYREGYIFNYYLSPVKNNFIVYPNHKVVTFKLSLISRASRKINFKFFTLKKYTNSGRFLIVKTCYGLQFSDTARFNKIGGQPIFGINYF